MQNSSKVPERGGCEVSERPLQHTVSGSEHRMIRSIIVILLGGHLLWGCATVKPDGATSTVTESPASHTLDFDPDEISDYRERVDSAVALYAFGDLADFVEQRDLLHKDVDTMIDSHPSVVFRQDFQELVAALSDLDALYPASDLGHAYLSETDSIALSIENWPEIDPTQSQTGSSTLDNTPFEVISNDRIDFWIRYFTGPGKERFERALYRMELYRPIIEPILGELGLHRDLMCVALIESGFNLKARSYARAVGPWQFIAGTARLYGLRVSWWYDERRDVVASTYAAGNYLNDLNGIWDDWLLALAAYNCGEYRVIRAIARQKTDDFWALKLPRQTERYVPKFLAALYIVREPEKYGFTIPEVEPVKFDQVTVKDATDVKVIARSAGTTVDYIMDLNPSLLRWCTPPKTEINVKIPVGTAEECALKLANIPPEDRVTWRRHTIRQGETLSQIATNYNTTVTTLKRLNGINNAHRIRAGKTLIVPVTGAYSEVASSKPQFKDKHRTINKAALENYAKRYQPPANHKRVVYVVKGGDTLGQIAEDFNTSAKKLRYWNNLSYRSYIHPGQKITIYVPDSFDTSGIQVASNSKPSESDFIRSNYTVKKGDTFYSISRKFDVGMVDLLAWNSKSTKSIIRPGDVLEIWRKKDR